MTVARLCAVHIGSYAGGIRWQAKENQVAHEIYIEPRTAAQRAWVADCRWLISWDEEAPHVGRVKMQTFATDGMVPIWERKLLAQGKQAKVECLREIIRRELGLEGPPPPNLWQRITARAQEARRATRLFGWLPR